MLSLGRNYGNALERIPEGSSQCNRFAPVAKRCSRAMRIDCFDLAGTQACFFEGSTHGSGGTLAVRPGSGHVVGIIRGAIAKNLTIDSRIASHGIAEPLQDYDSGSFGHDEAVSLQIEGPAGALGILVAGRHCTNGSKSTEGQRREGCLNPTRERGADIAAGDCMECLTDRHRTGRAGIRIRDGWPAMVELNSDVASRGASENRDRKQRSNCGETPCPKVVVLFLREGYPAQR